MKFLITNDDGIKSDGLLRLVRAAAELGEVWLVAPDGQRSAQSHSIRLNGPIIVRETEYPVPGVRAFACDGSPADCVRIGVLNIVPGRPDIVLSGINYGYNTATDLQYSATAGAALEAAFQGLHAIALSENAGEEHSVTDYYLGEILRELIALPPEDNTIWNVNFPGCRLEECRGILRGRKPSRDSFFHDRYLPAELEPGVISYTVDGIPNREAEEGTDMRALVENYVSIGIVHNLS